MRFTAFVFTALAFACAVATPVTPESPAADGDHLEAASVDSLASEGPAAVHKVMAQADQLGGVNKGGEKWDTRWGLGFCAGPDGTQGCYFFNAPPRTCVEVGSGTFASRSFVIYGDMPCVLYQGTGCSGTSYAITGPIQWQNSGWSVIGSFKCEA